MKSLWNKTGDKKLSDQVIVANTLFTRMKGLLGKDKLESNVVMWIHPCISIHTWFMKFNIDVVFVDKDLVVRAIFSDIGPWKMTWPVRKARSVFEMTSGTAKEFAIKIGDQLYVGD